LKLGVMQNGQLVDQVNEMFGIRTFEFDANTGFSLNGKRMKIKGVNLHHDAGAVGAAVPKAIWQYRIGKLKSIGTNAVRMAHNPHSKELMEVCDEMGMLVMNEAFDEWNRPKGKNLAYIGDGAAPKDASVAYPAVFDQWAERDLKDLILRDFNHPSVFMWSIGNEIEWTFPHYSKTYAEVNGADKKYYEFSPNYDSLTIKKAFDKITGGSDPLLAIAQKLSAWVKEVDTTRPVTCGNVLPSIGMASGYGSAVDVLGFNYRATEYDGAHKEYPNLKILGSENWGAYSEWKNSIDRDFVAGIFVWTGFAYLGEAGPWPRKGLNISFFDFAGFKTPRGHFYECLWQDTPKVYTVTTPANESEYSFSEKDGWNFTKQPSPPPVWPRLRDWEWYKVYPKWKYAEDESIIIQTYTNCEEAELFLNGVSLGKQKRADFADDNIIKWLAPYKAGELKVIGYNDGKKATEYSLNTHGSLAKIAIHTNKKELHADGYDVAVVTAKLLDENGLLITDADMEIEFELSGIIKNIGIDNGWEYNVQSHKSNAIKTHEGRAAIFLQAGQEASNATVKVRCGEVVSSDVGIEIR
ncbi:MAG: glycoside hydrolase family 2 protein, partial [Calditrichaeota bacterium]